MTGDAKAEGRRDPNVADWMSRVKHYMRYRLKLERQLQGMTVADVAGLAGIDPESVRRLEDDRGLSPRLDTLLRVCYAVQLNTARLFEPSAQVPAVVRLQVSRQPSKLAKLLESIKGVEQVFSDGKDVTAFVWFPDVDALGAFILDFMRVCGSHVTKTKTNVVIREYVSPLEVRAFVNPQRPIAKMLGLYRVSFEEQDKLAAALRLIPHVEKVMAVTGEEDLYVVVASAEAEEARRAVNEIRALRGIKEVQVWSDMPSGKV